MIAQINDYTSFYLTGAKEFKCRAIPCDKKFHSEHLTSLHVHENMRLRKGKQSMFIWSRAEIGFNLAQVLFYSSCTIV